MPLGSAVAMVSLSMAMAVCCEGKHQQKRLMRMIDKQQCCSSSCYSMSSGMNCIWKAKQQQVHCFLRKKGQVATVVQLYHCSCFKGEWESQQTYKIQSVVMQQPDRGKENLFDKQQLMCSGQWSDGIWLILWSKCQIRKNESCLKSNNEWVVVLQQHGAVRRSALNNQVAIHHWSKHLVLSMHCNIGCLAAIAKQQAMKPSIRKV